MNRKLIYAALLLVVVGATSAQSNQEAQVLSLSNTIFKWEVSNQLNSLVEVFDQKLMVVNATGEIQPRDQYLTALRSGRFVHNAIAIEENRSTVENNTATVVGNGQFTVTLSGICFHCIWPTGKFLPGLRTIGNYWRFLSAYSPINGTGALPKQPVAHRC